MSALKTFSSILSPSWKSMARLVLPSRLELKRRSLSVAPLALPAVFFAPTSEVAPRRHAFEALSRKLIYGLI
jgi:hypothetical protein